MKISEQIEKIQKKYYTASEIKNQLEWLRIYARRTETSKHNLHKEYTGLILNHNTLKSKYHNLETENQKLIDGMDRLQEECNELDELKNNMAKTIQSLLGKVESLGFKFNSLSW